MEHEIKINDSKDGGSLIPETYEERVQPQVVVSGDLPPEILPTITKCVIEMTEKEREEYFIVQGEENYKRYLKNKEAGVFNRCHKTDWCKLERERKEKEENEKTQLIETLTSRNQMLEKHARHCEERLKSNENDLTEYKKLTDERFNTLVKILNLKQ